MHPPVCPPPHLGAPAQPLCSPPPLPIRPSLVHLPPVEGRGRPPVPRVWPDPSLWAETGLLQALPNLPRRRLAAASLVVGVLAGPRVLHRPPADAHLGARVVVALVKGATVPRELKVVLPGGRKRGGLRGKVEQGGEDETTTDRAGQEDQWRVLDDGRTRATVPLATLPVPLLAMETPTHMGAGDHACHRKQNGTMARGPRRCRLVRTRR